MNAMLENWSKVFMAGGLFGVGAGALLLLNGRIAGVSGIAAELLESPTARQAHSPQRWPLLVWLSPQRVEAATFVLGLAVGGALLARLWPESVREVHWLPAPWLAFAGLLVGLGAKLGNGCTSGHGVCGVGRWSKRSLVAVTLFVLTGMAVRATVGAP